IASLNLDDLDRITVQGEVRWIIAPSGLTCDVPQRHPVLKNPFLSFVLPRIREESDVVHETGDDLRGEGPAWRTLENPFEVTRFDPLDLPSAPGRDWVRQTLVLVQCLTDACSEGTVDPLQVRHSAPRRRIRFVRGTHVRCSSRFVHARWSRICRRPGPAP